MCSTSLPSSLCNSICHLHCYSTLVPFPLSHIYLGNLKSCQRAVEINFSSQIWFFSSHIQVFMLLTHIRIPSFASSPQFVLRETVLYIIHLDPLKKHRIIFFSLFVLLEIAFPRESKIIPEDSKINFTALELSVHFMHTRTHTLTHTHGSLAPPPSYARFSFSCRFVSSFSCRFAICVRGHVFSAFYLAPLTT